MKKIACSKILGIVLACLVTSVTFGALSNNAYAAKFDIGDTVEVTANLNVRTGPGTSYPEITDPDYLGYAPTGTIGKVLSGPSSADGYIWWQVDFGPGWYSGWSVEGGLEKVSQPPPAPVITSPGSSTGPGPVIGTLTPTLQWNPVSGADYYALAISKYPYGAGNIIYNPQQVYGSSLTIPSGVLVYDQKYRWNMQAHNSAGWSAVSNTLYFQTPPPPTQPDLTVTSVSAPTSAEPGSYIAVSWTVKNQGSASSGLFYNRISLATTPYGTDISLGNFLMSSISPGASLSDAQVPKIPESVSPGYYYVTVYADTFQSIAESNENNNINKAPSQIRIVTPTEIVSTPNTPSGPTEGTVGTSYTYSSGGSSSNLGHGVQYRFYWGDGFYSSWSFSASASHSWSAPGTYIIRSQARCATHTSVVSNWSTGLSVTVNPPTNGSISGRVYQSDGIAPIAGAMVGVFDYSSPRNYGWIPTNADGSYTFTGLATGTYAVRVEADGYAVEWYDGVLDKAEAIPVSVVAPNNTPGINFTLEPGSSIVGHVYESDGTTPIVGAQVDVFHYDSLSGKWVGYETTWTRPDGSYKTSGLPTGTYNVRVKTDDYGVEWYDNAYETLKATPVSVIVPNDTLGIDFILESANITQAWTSDSIRGPEITNFRVRTSRICVNYDYENPAGSVQKITCYDSEGNVLRTHTHVTQNPSGTGTWTLTYPGEQFWPSGSYWANIFINDLFLDSVPWTVQPYFANAHSVHFESGHYIVELMISDPESKIESVSVTGPRIDGSTFLVRGTHPFYPDTWWSRPNVNLGMSPSGLPLVYTFTITEKAGSTYIVEDSVLSYVETFATNLSPSNNEIVTGEIVFSWTGIDLPEVRYKIELSDDQGNRIWDSPSTITNTYYVYDGPPLSPGGYQYYVCSWSKYGDSSLAYAAFAISANQLPVADIDIDLAWVSSGDKIDFNASQSCDPDGAIVSYEWDFGDGTAETGASLSQVSHRFRGAMNEPKTYQVTLIVRDEQGATGSDTAEITVRPLEKTIEISPPPQPVPSNAFAKMTAYYNWVGETVDTGEDVYVISKIQFEAQGYISYVLSIWDEYSFSLGIPMWSKGFVYFWQPVEKSFIYPFGSYRDRTYTFGDGYFEGMAVGTDDFMRLWAFGVVEISGVMGPTWDGASVSFAPDSAQEPVTDEAPPDFDFAYLCSPGELRVYDSQGNVTGLVNGEVKQEIPDSGYSDGIVVVLNPLDSYYYEVLGMQEGLYGLGVTSMENGEATSFTATDIPTTSGAIHQYTVDWDALSQGEDGVTLQIDSQGDGTFEETVTADNELTGDEFILQTSTIIDFDPDTFNLSSKGKVVTVYIELPLGYDVGQIDISTILLNDVVPAFTEPTQIDDYDDDGIPDLMVKFDRAAVQEILTPGDAIEITVTGKVAGIDFEGSDIIRVINESE